MEREGIQKVQAGDEKGAHAGVHEVLRAAGVLKRVCWIDITVIDKCKSIVWRGVSAGRVSGRLCANRRIRRDKVYDILGTEASSMAP